MKTITIKLYTFNELSEKSQSRAFSNHWRFINTINTYENLQKDESYIKEDLETNKYYFLKNGDLLDLTTI